MTQEWFKAVRLDRTSHYDQETRWRKGAKVIVPNPDPPEGGPCGVGIHICPTLLDAVYWQGGPSRYYRVKPLGKILARDESKARVGGVRVLDELSRKDQDALAGFRLYESNHPAHPLLRAPRLTRSSQKLLEDWASVWASVRASVLDSVGDSVWDSVRASVRASVGDSVRPSVGASVWASVRASVRPSVWDSVRASVWAYVGSLFPGIRQWRYAESLGPEPWAPVRKLWLAGLVPSFDGVTWRLHGGPDAEVMLEWRPE